MVEVVITNAYCYLNKGDGAIIVSMLKVLKKLIPDARFTVLSLHPTYDRAFYQQYGATVYSEIMRGSALPWRSKAFFRMALWALLGKCKINASFLIQDPEKLKAMEKIASANLVISCGGGFLNDNWGRAFWVHLYSLSLAKFFNRPLMIYAQSIGPFRDKLNRFLTRNVLNRVDLITVREEISKECLQSIGVCKPPIYTTADSTFLLPSADSKRIDGIVEREGIGQERPLVGIGVRRWIYPRSPHLKHQKNRGYKLIIAKLADYVIEKFDATPVFIPTVSIPGSYYDNDDLMSREMVGLMKNKDVARIVSAEYGPEEFKGLMGRMDMVVGTRYYSVVFPVQMGVPVVAISYEEKTEGFMRVLNFERFVCDIETLDLDDLLSKVNEVWNRRDIIRKGLKDKVKFLEERSLLNAKLAVQLLK